MKKINYIFLIGIMGLIFSCNDMRVGYLQTENAAFVPNTLEVSRTIDKESPRYKNKAPWTSLRIQGVAGTTPINYAFEGVKSESSEKEELFTKAVERGEITVIGGIVQVYQSAVKALPNGEYTISIRVYNEGYSNILKDVFKIIVTDRLLEEN